MGPRTWVGGCGATWQTGFTHAVAPTDSVTDRVIDLLDTCTDAGVVDVPRKGSVLTWETTLELARRIAGDTELRARMLAGGAR